MWDDITFVKVRYKVKRILDFIYLLEGGGDRIFW